MEADVATVHVHVDGPEGARLEERSSSGDDPWRVVCSLPCSASVVPSPAAEHRIVDDARGTDGIEDASIGPNGGDVTYSRGSLAAKIAVRTSGIIITTAGSIGLGLGIAGLMAGMCPASSVAEAREIGGLFLLGGAAITAAGVTILVRGRNIGRASVEYGTREEREKPWQHRGDAPPPLPRTYATIFSGTF